MTGRRCATEPVGFKAGLPWLADAEPAAESWRFRDVAERAYSEVAVRGCAIATVRYWPHLDGEVKDDLRPPSWLDFQASCGVFAPAE